eukprot:CAMPEP_0176365056 /NCGR_PEP_ID=MMETSP0126-20121128/20204_1 /TAXON_ID=141414 ORGANISM="Strombidinopsis acuminatum, Strain SPMC142" /NCGR_SAMPLE_ID=MMETSP0126 /ASSEMBLY_ACC=CAM_ASM_000229 /LENGTH=101 /DNA_ID=CAMNT_0017721907 /DNA_START=971 /DNA_END=1276 /DNA_ORIENTATION=-
MIALNKLKKWESGLITFPHYCNVGQLATKYALLKLYKDQDKNDEKRRALCPSTGKELSPHSPLESFYDLEAYANFVLDMVKLESTYFDVALDKIYLFSRVR